MSQSPRQRNQTQPYHAPAPPHWLRFPIPTLTLNLALLVFLVFPRVHSNAHLLMTFLSVVGLLVGWHIVLGLRAKAKGRTLGIELVRPLPTHVVQAGVQLGLYAYWGWFWRPMVDQIPLIVAQLVFLCVFDALLAWSRGRAWRPGLGILPVIFSVNFFMWFRDDVFAFQFVMIAAAALCKEFITWNRDGRRTHIFNPSAIALTLVSIVLILTQSTNLTWARELADSFDAVPSMIVAVFIAGLIVQALFSVTLMTMATVAALAALNMLYTHFTGSYQFITTNLSAAIFLGAHLLITDPSTSPRSNLGRVIFGLLYGTGIFYLFDLLGAYRVPELYAKLLIVPALNLSVIWIDWLARTGPLGAISRAWESALPRKPMNFVHMGCWAGLFCSLWFGGFFIGSGGSSGPHPGNSIAFWKQAIVDGKPHAERKLTILCLVEANKGNGAALNELGLMALEGNDFVPRDRANAARFFSEGCALRDGSACANVAVQFLFLNEWRSEDEVLSALDLLEADCSLGSEGHPQSCYLAGFAYETGQGRDLSLRHAAALYKQVADRNLYAVKGLVRLALMGLHDEPQLRPLATVLARACEAGDAEACWYLAYLYATGTGVTQSDATARAILQRACELGSAQACRALEAPTLPAFERPRPMTAPGWSTAYPLPRPEREAAHE